MAYPGILKMKRGLEGAISKVQAENVNVAGGRGACVPPPPPPPGEDTGICKKGGGGRVTFKY